jgi:ribonuclease HI
MGLEEAINCNITNLSVCGDSLLVINQVNGVYRVRHVNLIPLYEKVMELKKQFIYIDFSHVYRNENTRADKLSNIGLELSNKEIYNPLVKESKSFLPKINTKN